MTTLRIALRVLRGGGARGALRLALMMLGVAVGVTAVLFLQSMPGVLRHRGEVSGSRQPHYATAGAPTVFRYSQVDGLWNDLRFTRVLIADVQASAPAPPGLTAVPGPGEIVVSPAAARLRATDPRFAQLIPGTVRATIAPAGLVDPNELYAYVGVDDSVLGHSSPAAGWGGDPDQRTANQFTGVTLELTALILGPTIIYLLVCASLSASTRTRRYSALRLVGAEGGTILRIAGMEAAVSGAGGGLAGVGLYALANRWIGPGNLVGFAWYADVSRLHLATAVVAVLVVAAASAGIAAIGTATALAKPLAGRFDVAEPVARWWLAVPLVLGLGVLCVPLFLDRRPSAAGGGYAQANTAVAGLLIAGMTLCTVGFLLALRPLLSMVARAFGRPGVAMSVRIAARRVELEPAGTVRLMSGLVLLVLVSGIGAGVLHLVELSALPSARVTSATVQARDIPAPARAAALRSPAQRSWITDGSVLAPPADDVQPSAADLSGYVNTFGVPMIVAPCADVATALGYPLRGCVDGQAYRLADAHADPAQVPALPAGYPLRYLDAAGAAYTFRAPSAQLSYPGGFGSVGPQILITMAMPPHGISPTAGLTYLLSTDPVAINSFLTRLAAISPNAEPTINNFDLDLLEVYRTQHGTVEFGVTLGFLLGMLAFAIAAVDRTVERRRQVSALAVLGFRPRTLRLVQFWQYLGSVGVCLTAAVVIAHVVGNAFLRLDNLHSGWFYGTIASSLPLAGAGVLVAALTSTVIAGANPRAEDLRRE